MAYPDGKVVFDGVAYAMVSAFATATASGTNEVVASATTKIRVLRHLISAETSNTVQWRGGTTGRSGDLFIGVNGGIAEDSPADGYLFDCATGEALNLYQATSGRTSANVLYVRI